MNLANYIDHTILKPEATKQDVLRLCDEAKQYGFASVCVNAYYTKLVADALSGSDVKTCVVVGFPLGATFTEIKAHETELAIQNGATEVDMVINVGALKDKDYTTVEQDIKAVVNAAKSKAIVKVIIETCLLTDEEKVKACELSVQAGADFVKTSTGFSTGGATVEDIALMRKTVGDKAQVKASGGVRDFKGAKAMVDAGANRIGASSGIKIVMHQEEVAAPGGMY
ncbi:deoxyribose-phosphate aldolase [Niameybacter sp.]|uniref:deoxyribose-phosphate aldolase n=1 Tax=Niameybacter sp. TaxID=2033640 RepID=UPI002FC85885